MFPVTSTVQMGFAWMMKDAQPASVRVIPWSASRSTAATIAPMDEDVMTVDVSYVHVNLLHAV